MNWPEVLLKWTFDPSVVIGIVLAAALYWRGWRPVAIVRGTRGKPARRWHAASFYAGLAVIVLALESPIDALSSSLFTFHMLQHLLLIMVAAPLLILGDPGVTMLRGIPLSVRRAALGAVARQTWFHALGRWASRLTSPVAAFVIFLADLYLWHWSPLFNLTLRNDTVHVFEHVCFIATSLLLWSQVIDQRALQARLSYVQRAVYTLLVAAAGNILAMYFVFTPKPAYAPYASLVTRPYGMTAVGDQQTAGALMWVPVLFFFGGAFAIFLYKALAEEEHRSEGATVSELTYAAYGFDSTDTFSSPAPQS